MGLPSWYLTSHSGQLSLAIPSWVGVMSTGAVIAGEHRVNTCVTLTVGILT